MSHVRAIVVEASRRRTSAQEVHLLLANGNHLLERFPKVGSVNISTGGMIGNGLEVFKIPASVTMHRTRFGVAEGTTVSSRIAVQAGVLDYPSLTRFLNQGQIRSQHCARRIPLGFPHWRARGNNRDLLATKLPDNRFAPVAIAQAAGSLLSPRPQIRRRDKARAPHRVYVRDAGRAETHFGERCIGRGCRCDNQRFSGRRHPVGHAFSNHGGGGDS